MGRNLSSLFISQSYQFLTQISGSELQDGLGNTITGSLAITSSKALQTFTQQTNANVNHFVAFVATTNDYETLETDNQLIYNPNQNLLTVTASLANNAISSSFATTASFALNAGTVSTASLLTTASAVNNVITFTKGDGSTFPVTVDTGSGGGSVNTGSLLTTASFNDAQITFTKGDGSTFSGVINNVTSSISASFATTATSASFATSATSASFATSASQAVTSSVALKVRTTDVALDTGAHFILVSNEAQAGGQATVQYDGNVWIEPNTNTLRASTIRANTYNDINSTGNASFLGNATTATTATTATSASFATSASQAQNANTASFALNIANNLSPTFANVTASNALITGTASIAFLNVTIESSSVIYSSGSNQFGDASNDTQTIFGTVDIKTGPLVVTGSSTFTNTITGAQVGNIIPFYFANQAAFPSAATYHGAVAHSHADGKMFFAHGNVWNELANATGSLQGTASFATSASQAQNTVSASYAVFATGAGAANSATSASYAVSASFAENALSASYAPAGDPFPYTGSAIITGSLLVTGSVRGNISALTISSNTASLDCSKSNFFTLSLVSGSVTHVNPTNINPGQTINLQLIQPAVGYGNITYPYTIRTQNGQQITPTLAANAIDVVSLVTFDTSLLFATTVKNLT